MWSGKLEIRIVDSLHNLNIRPIEFGRDIMALSAFLDEADQRHLQQVQGAIQDGDSIVLVAEVQGQVVGWAVVQTRYRNDLGWEPDADALWFVSGENAYLENLEVKASFRGMGIGRELLAAAEEEVGQRGRRILWLHAAERNYGACSFYEREGWRHERTVYPAWRNGAPTRIYMKPIA
ncbi:MAG: family N-acetyltransferase [Chthonomonadaceae bacterium]|nr:family N-acetyltransferase [Chthonomonadaceae bacterium]